MYKDLPIQKLIDVFIEKGGRINPFYLKNPKQTPTLVFFKNWYRGKNIRDAITRALNG